MTYAGYATGPGPAAVDAVPPVTVPNTAPKEAIAPKVVDKLVMLIWIASFVEPSIPTWIDNVPEPFNNDCSLKLANVVIRWYSA